MSVVHTYKIIARPYAKAAYLFAAAHKNIELWKIALANAALVVDSPVLLDALRANTITNQHWLELFSCVLADAWTAEIRNFIKLLLAYHRVRLLPFISELFEEYRVSECKSITVNVTTAIALTSSQEQALLVKLVEKFQVNVELKYVIDPDIVGGLLLSIGDLTVDGSVNKQLVCLLESMIG